MRKIRWGVLSTARIGTSQVIPAMQQGTYSDMTAIASRDAERAAHVAQTLGIRKAYGSYAELLADPEVEAVYIPLPNEQHVPWSIKALEAGKHVLCEKPIALTADEAQTLFDAAAHYPQLKVMEAFMYRFHPQWQRAKELAASGAIGDVRTIQSFFSYSNLDPANIRNRAENGGGGLMDIGCYNVSFSRFIFGQEPTRVCGVLEYDPTFKTDRLVSSIMDFASGTATFTCATQLSPYQRVNIFGTTGRIEVEIPVNAPAKRPCRIWLAHGTAIDELVFEPSNQHTIQGDLFSRSILDNTPVPTPLEDAVANMRVIDAIIQSGRSNSWVEVRSSGSR